MKIFTVTEDEFRGAVRLFKEHQVEVLPKKYTHIKADLIIFTGGEDILPSYYGRPVPKFGDFNPGRDEWEMKVFKDIISENIEGNVLGWCRGMQLINVGFGGILYYDIKRECGLAHKSTHPINWTDTNRLAECFPMVNSLHHQGIKSCRDSSGYKLLAYEPNTGVPEIAKWRDRFLGVQFHPEMMSELEGTQKFVQILEEWVAMKSPVDSVIKRKTPVPDLFNPKNQYITKIKWPSEDE